MRAYRFRTMDVFTDRRFGGNPLAVFPDARGLTDEEMQSLAREFNLSETTFVLPPSDPAHTARVRIFTPGTELPFAGHPLVGTGTLLAESDKSAKALTLEVTAGLVRVEIERDASGRLTNAVITAPKPLTLGREFTPADLADCLTLQAKDFVVSNHQPVFAGTGNPFIIAEVTAEAIGRAKCDIGAFGRAAEKFGMQDRFNIHFYAKDGDKIRARMYGPSFGIIEDPATGSANTPLAALLLSLSGKESDSYQVLQGVEMGRPSLLNLTARRQEDGIVATVGGSCVPMFEGFINL